MLVIALLLFILGLAGGSFINALVWRMYQQSLPKSRRKKGVNLSIVNGRSVCPKCGHVLGLYDLIPIASWLWLRGRCRYCRRPIDDSPVVELIMGVIFAASYIFWPQTVHLGGQWLLLGTWLAAAVGLMALAVYDLKWMLLPNKIVYPTLGVSAAGQALYIVFFAARPLHAVLLWIFSLAIASGVFLVLFIISKGKWIGFGDVRLGLVTGTLLADPQKSLAMIFLASLIGTLAVSPSLFKGNKTLASRLPYGPFLIGATAIIILFGDSLLNWYKSLII